MAAMNTPTEFSGSAGDMMSMMKDAGVTGTEGAEQAAKDVAAAPPSEPEVLQSNNLPNLTKRHLTTCPIQQRDNRLPKVTTVQCSRHQTDRFTIKLCLACRDVIRFCVRFLFTLAFFLRLGVH